MAKSKPIKKTRVVWLAREFKNKWSDDVLGFPVKPEPARPDEQEYHGTWIYEHNELWDFRFPWFCGKLGLRPGQLKKKRVTVIVEDVE